MKNISLFGVVNSLQMEKIAIEVLRSGSISSGPYIGNFEQRLGVLLGQPNLLTMSNMTSAITLALRLSNIKPGDGVLTTSFACMSTNAPIAAIGAQPIWVDLAKNSASCDLATFKNAVTPNTRAAIVYHTAGYPAPILEISEFCKKNNISLIEDCDNALLATVNGKTVGSYGDFAVYSFYPNRQINTLEGGALVCKDVEKFERAKKLRRFGIDAKTFRNALGEISPSSDIPEITGSDTMSNFSAALGSAQIDSVLARIEQARENAKRIAEELSGCEELKIVRPLTNSQAAYWVFLLQTNKRDELLMALKSLGIHSSALHFRNDIYTGFMPSNSAILSNTEEWQKTVLAIPCGWWLNSDNVGDLILSVKDALLEVSPPKFKV